MALLFVDSFSHYATADVFADKWTQWGGSASGTIVPGGGLYGSGCLAFTATEYVMRPLTMTGNTPRGVVGFRMRIDNPGATFLAIQSTDSNFDHILLQYTVGGVFQVSNYLGSIGQTAAGLVTTGVSSPGVYFYFECRFYIHPTAGEVELRINGVRVLNLTGVRTRGHPSFVATDTVTGFRLGTQLGGQWRAADLYFLDDQVTAADGNVGLLGDCRVECHFVTGIGAHGSFVPVGDTPGWRCVKDTSDNVTGVPDGDTTYVSSSVPGDIDTYPINPMSANILAVKAIQVLVRQKKSDAGARTTAIVLRQGATDHPQASFTPANGVYGYNRIVLSKDGSNSTWTTSVNSIEVGQKILS